MTRYCDSLQGGSYVQWVDREEEASACVKELDDKEKLDAARAFFPATNRMLHVPTYIQMQLYLGKEHLDATALNAVHDKCSELQ